jgi:hypothetical protein
MSFRRIVHFEPGYNYLHETGPRRRGQHGMQIRFVLAGPEGATQFLMGTGWTPLGQVDEGVRENEPCHVDHWQHFMGSRFGQVNTPSGYDVGYHWRTPMWDDQTSMGPCAYLGGDECFYDGSGLRADPILRDFIAKGEPAVWRALIDEYRLRSQEARELVTS